MKVTHVKVTYMDEGLPSRRQMRPVSQKAKAASRKSSQVPDMCG
jgi:hypothetical protein